MKKKIILRIASVLMIVSILAGTTACSRQGAVTPNNEQPNRQEESITTEAPQENAANGIQGIMDMVSKDMLYDYVAGLSGEKEITYGNQTTTLKTRRTGTQSFQAASQYVYEVLEKAGLDVSYQSGEIDLVLSGFNITQSYSNIVAEKKGSLYPDEVIILSAHLDSIGLEFIPITSEQPIDETTEMIDPEEDYAPGADDNATGSAAVMHIAELLSQYDFERTIRFVLFDGEEDARIGSQGYVKMLEQDNTNIKAVINLDMLGWETDGNPVLSLVTQPTDASGYAAEQEIVQAFSDVIENYGLVGKLIVEKTEEEKEESDHVSFWNANIPAVLAIEDWNDFNPNANQKGDNIDNLNMDYYTNTVKAITGVVVVLAGLVE